MKLSDMSSLQITSISIQLRNCSNHASCPAMFTRRPWAGIRDQQMSAWWHERVAWCFSSISWQEATMRLELKPLLILLPTWWWKISLWGAARFAVSFQVSSIGATYSWELARNTASKQKRAQHGRTSFSARAANWQTLHIASKQSAMTASGANSGKR